MATLLNVWESLTFSLPPEQNETKPDWTKPNQSKLTTGGSDPGWKEHFRGPWSTLGMCLGQQSSESLGLAWVFFFFFLTKFIIV
jgi:hypothetical protein